MTQRVRSTELRRDSEGVVRHGGEWLLLWADPDDIRSAAARDRARDAGRAEAEARRHLAAAFRSVARTADTTVLFAAELAAIQANNSRSPVVTLPAPGPNTWRASRGAADAFALARRFAVDWPAPDDPRHAPVVAALHQARCEALGIRLMPGVLTNLAAFTVWRHDRMGVANATLAADLPVAEAVGVALRGLLAGVEDDLASLGLRLWRGWIRSALAPQLAALAAALDDPPAYTAAAPAFVRALFAALGAAEAPGPGDDRLPEPDPAGDGDDAPAIRPRSLSVQMDAPDSPVGDRAARPAALSTPALPAPYAAFTTAHDRVLAPEDVCPPAELLALRARLDAGLGDAGALLVRLTNQLQRRLQATSRRDWDFDLDEGLLDAGRLDRVVVDPASSLSFKRERDATDPDSVVSLLIDCSGSMRGRPILLAAMAADVIARALDRCGITSEVLGFTTADWTGGESGGAWVRAGRPANPGRLGDLRHLIIKPAGISYRRARLGFGLPLRPGLLRENVDGEALAWAAARLRTRPERRRVLVVISDGAPAETETVRANPPGLLAQHLRATIAGIEARGAIELRAIGIGHDVAAYYQRAVTVANADMLGPALIRQLDAVFAEPAARRTAGRARWER